MAKVLVVDDEHDIQDLFLQHFRKEIRQGDLEFVFSFSGEEAMSFIEILLTGGKRLALDGTSWRVIFGIEIDHQPFSGKITKTYRLSILVE